MRWAIAAAGLATFGGVAAADPGHGVAIEAPVPPQSPLVFGAHVGVSRVVVSTDTNDAAGYGPWVDVEAGARVAAHVAVLGVLAYARDSATYTDMATMIEDRSTYTHLAGGARVQVEVTPSAWIGGGVMYMHESDAFDRTHPGSAAVTGTDYHSSPAVELRAGLEAARIGRLRFQIVASGAVFQPDTHGFFSTVATLAVGAQWR